MASEPNVVMPSAWSAALPLLTGRLVSMRELAEPDAPFLIALLSLGDSAHFGVLDPSAAGAIPAFINEARRDRAAGRAFTYVVVDSLTGVSVGLLQVRQLDSGWQAAEWEFTVVPGARGTGIALEAAQLAGAFAFEVVGAHRLEARVLLQNGRANGALRKLGAVQEGVLRRSARYGDTYVDQALWSLVKDDWSTHRAVGSGRIH